MASIHGFFAPSMMAPRLGSILVHAGLTRDAQSVTRAAVEVANSFGARLVGVSTPSALFRQRRTSAVEQDVDQRLGEAAGEAFEALTRGVRAGAVWRRADASPVGALAEFAWAADLIMVSRQLVGAGGRLGERLTALLVRLGPPLLVQPCEWRAGPAERLVVLWEGTGACRRALKAALPFISRATSTTILIPMSEQRRSAGELADVQRGLDLRGLRVHPSYAAISGARGLLDCAQELTPHLIVAGARSGPRPWPFLDGRSRLPKEIQTPIVWVG